MNTDITFCVNRDCKIRQYCKRGVDIREGDLLLSYDNFNCMSSDNFFIDLKLPIVVHEFNPQHAIDFADWILIQLQMGLVTREDCWKYLLDGELITTEELYKIYKDDKHK